MLLFSVIYGNQNSESDFLEAYEITIFMSTKCFTSLKVENVIFFNKRIPDGE